MVLAICQAQLWPCPGWQFSKWAHPKGSLAWSPTWPGSLDSDLHDHGAQHQAKTKFRVESVNFFDQKSEPAIPPTIRAVNSLVQILCTIFIYLIIQERLRTHLIIKARLEPSLNVGSSQRTDQGAIHPRSIARAQLKPGLITNLNQNLWSVRKHSLWPHKNRNDWRTSDDWGSTWL